MLRLRSGPSSRVSPLSPPLKPRPNTAVLCLDATATAQGHTSSTTLHSNALSSSSYSALALSTTSTTSTSTATTATTATATASPSTSTVRTHSTYTSPSLSPSLPTIAPLTQRLCGSHNALGSRVSTRGKLTAEPGTLKPVLDVEGEDKDTQKRRLLWSSRHRGTLENELILGTFIKEHFATLSDDEVAAFEALLLETDPDIWKWLNKKEDPPSHVDSHLLGRLQEHLRNDPIRKIRETPGYLQESA